MRVSNRTDGANADENEPDKKQAEDDSGQRAAESVDEPGPSETVLSGSFEKKRAKARDDAVNHDGQERAADHRHDKVRPFQNRPQQRKHEIATEIGGSVGSDYRRSPHQLPGKSEPISANNFEEKQHHGEGNEHGLPKRRARGHGFKISD